MIVFQFPAERFGKSPVPPGAMQNTPQQSADSSQLCAGPVMNGFSCSSFSASPWHSIYRLMPLHHDSVARPTSLKKLEKFLIYLLRGRNRGKKGSWVSRARWRS